MIESGKLDVIINEEIKNTLNAGESFGDLALMYNAPRSASIQAKEDCVYRF